MLDVGLGVLDVERRVRDVEVAAQHGLPAAARGLVPQLAHAREHGVEEAVFLRHFHRIVAVARVHVHACDGDSIALWRRHVGLDPSAGIHILVQPGQTVSPGCHGQVGQQPDAGASLDAADLVHRRQLALVGDLAGGGVFEPELVEYRIELVLRGTDLLHAPDVRGVLARPGLDALALGGADAVHVGCGDGDHGAILYPSH